MKQAWEVFKKSFSLSFTVEMTTTKLLAWGLFIVMCVFTEDIPEEGKAFFIITMSGIIAALYTGKNIQNHYKRKKEGEDV
jgi:hypothetical protein